MEKSQQFHMADLSQNMKNTLYEGFDQAEQRHAAAPTCKSQRSEQLIPLEENAIKLFVGQLPRQWSDRELRAYFEAFGPIYEFIVLQDKRTGVGQGCGFLTYCRRNDAQRATDALHDKVHLPGTSHKIQIKNCENLKLFVGKLPLLINEAGICEIFEKFGTINDIKLHYDRRSGDFKGSCFIHFDTVPAAYRAIEHLNQRILPNCQEPLVVKFAKCNQMEGICKENIRSVPKATDGIHIRHPRSTQPILPLPPRPIIYEAPLLFEHPHVWPMDVIQTGYPYMIPRPPVQVNPSKHPMWGHGVWFPPTHHEIPSYGPMYTSANTLLNEGFPDRFVCPSFGHGWSESDIAEYSSESVDTNPSKQDGNCDASDAGTDGEES